MRPGDPRFFAPGILSVTLLAALLRLVRLGQVPVALYCDEAFNAYQAWSLLLTGRDTRGVLLPLFFDIFGKGWGEPLYFYLTIPPVAVLGLTPAAARLAAALSGTVAVAVTGLMTRAVLSGILSRGQAATAGISAAAAMAVSPWAIHFSRIGFQASLLPTVLATGFWLLWSAPSSKRGSFRAVIGAFTLGSSLYTYSVSRLALPLLLAGFLLFDWRTLRRGSIRPSAALAAALVVVILATPMLLFSLGPDGQQRFSDVSILRRPGLADAGWPGLAAAVATNYLSYFSPAFLLTEGDPNPRHSIPNHGVLHPHEVLLLLIGCASALALRGAGPRFLLWWIAAAPVAASLTIDARHAVRAIPMQPGLYAAIGLGVAILLSLHASVSGTRARVSAALLVVMLLAVLVSTGLYLRDYHLRWPVSSGPAWQYGLPEAYAWVDTHLEGHDSVYVTRNEDYPWIQLLFFRRFDPRLFQINGLSGTPYLFDQEVFYRGESVPGRRNPIFVLKPWELDARLSPRHVVHYPDGAEAFVIAW